MSELFVLFRHDTQQWYHSLSPRGVPLWVDKEEHAQYLTKEEGERIDEMLRTWAKTHTYTELLPVNG